MVSRDLGTLVRMSEVIKTVTPADRILIRELGEALGKVSEVAFAYLFGSRARGEGRAFSDIDLAVMLRPSAAHLDGAQRLWFLAPKLVAIAGDRLDLVFLDRTGVVLSHRILRDGLLIYDGDPVARVRHRVGVVSRYLDTAHLRAVQIEATRRSAQEGGQHGRSRDPRAALARLG